jgi:hypothetical protein
MNPVGASVGSGPARLRGPSAVMRVFGGVLFFALVSGCGYPAAQAPDSGGQHPTKLATRIAGADSIVATSCLALRDQEHRDMKFVITGATVRKIIRAVSQAGRLPEEVNNIPSWTLEFYQGTNNLEFISFEGNTFNYGGVDYDQYRDASKVLENLEAELTERAKK